MSGLLVQINRRPVTAHACRMQVWSHLRRLHSCCLSALVVAGVALVCLVELGVLRRSAGLKDYECEMTYLYWKPKYIVRT